MMGYFDTLIEADMEDSERYRVSDDGQKLMPTQYPWEDPAGWRRAMRGLPPPFVRDPEAFVYVEIRANEWSELPELFAEIQKKINARELKPLPAKDDIPGSSPPLLLSVVVGAAEVLAVPLTFEQKPDD